VSGLPRVQLADLVLDERPKRSGTNAVVWNLNLDQVESGTGRILDRVRVHPDQLGSSTYPFEAGTVLYSKLRPYLNKVVIADEPGYATTELVPLRCDRDKVLPGYLAYFLRSQAFLSFANTVVAGAKMPRMVMSEFWKYRAPLPPLVEQRRIAAILDKADALRTKRRETLAQLDRLAQSIFVEMFGDPATNPKGFPRRKLGEIIKFEGGAQPPLPRSPTTLVLTRYGSFRFAISSPTGSRPSYQRRWRRGFWRPTM
jgi:type I restriction enzyme, S subunit